MKVIPEKIIEASNNLGETTDGCGGSEESVTIRPNPEYEAAIADIQTENGFDPWVVADKMGDPLLTPMDNKTIKNAILKRIPQARKIQLVRKGNLGAMQIVIVCQADYPGERACVLIELDANVFMRHKDLMNIVDRFWSELQDRKKRKKTNQLPASFLRSDEPINLARFSK